jgi:hypothetical protein
MAQPNDNASAANPTWIKATNSSKRKRSSPISTVNRHIIITIPDSQEEDNSMVIKLVRETDPIENTCETTLRWGSTQDDIEDADSFKPGMGGGFESREEVVKESNIVEDIDDDSDEDQPPPAKRAKKVNPSQQEEKEIIDQIMEEDDHSPHYPIPDAYYKLNADQPMNNSISALCPITKTLLEKGSTESFDCGHLVSDDGFCLSHINYMKARNDYLKAMFIIDKNGAPNPDLCRPGMIWDPRVRNDMFRPEVYYIHEIHLRRAVDNLRRTSCCPLCETVVWPKALRRKYREGSAFKPIVI